MDTYIGIIDLGSNSARLVIYYQNSSGSLSESDNIKRTLRLSSHLKDGRLDAEGVRITLDCMKQFKQLCDARGVTEVIGVATAAVRQAANGPELIASIHGQTGVRIRILSGEEEAYYGYLAVVNSMSVQDAFTVDIGGGSTEVTRIRDRKIVERISFPFGAVTLTQRFVKNDLPTAADLQALERFLSEQFARVPWLKQAQTVPLVALGGAARNVANIHQKKRKYPMSSIHQYVMAQPDVTEIYRQLAVTPLDKRKKIKGLSVDRGDIIVAAGAVFHMLLSVTGSREFWISTKGLRDGVLFERSLHARGQQEPLVDDVALYSAGQWIDRYRINRVSAEHVSRLALGLFDQMRELGLLAAADTDRCLVQLAALLYDAGRSINVFETRQHTAYLLANVLLMGLTHRERIMLALIASYKSDKKLDKQLQQYPGIVSPEDAERIKRLGLIVWLCRTLDRSMTQAVKRVEVTKKKEQYVLRCAGIKKDLVEYTLLHEILEQFEKSFRHRMLLKSAEEA